MLRGDARLRRGAGMSRRCSTEAWMSGFGMPMMIDFDGMDEDDDNNDGDVEYMRVLPSCMDFMRSDF